jgi:hypothetical protein
VNGAQLARKSLGSGGALALPVERRVEGLQLAEFGFAAPFSGKRSPPVLLDDGGSG